MRVAGHCNIAKIYLFLGVDFFTKKNLRKIVVAYLGRLRAIADIFCEWQAACNVAKCAKQVRSANEISVRRRETMSKTRESAKSITVTLKEVIVLSNGKIRLSLEYSSGTVFNSDLVLIPRKDRSYFWEGVIDIEREDALRIDSIVLAEQEMLRKNFLENLAAERIKTEDILDKIAEEKKIEKLLVLEVEGKLYRRNDKGQFEKI